LLPRNDKNRKRTKKGKIKEEKMGRRSGIPYGIVLPGATTNQSHMARQRDPSRHSLACHICRTLTPCTLPTVGPKSQILNSHQIGLPHLTLDICGSLTILRYALQISKIVDAADAAGPFFLVSSSDLVANQDCSTHTPPKPREIILLRRPR